MTLVTKTKQKDFSEVVALINHVFGKEEASLKMEAIFSDLLCEDNMAHMHIIKVDDKPISVVNYIINAVEINGCIIQVAQIGAVCTHEDHRRKGYSDKILNESLGKMRQEGVDLLYVSGDIALYTNNNIHITGRMYNFKIEQKDIAEHEALQTIGLKVKEYSQEAIDDIYNKETVKFIRNKQRFFDLANRVPSVLVFNSEAKIFVIEENGQIQGYFICAIIQKENGNFEMEVVEYAGERQLVLAGIIKIMRQFNPTTLSGYTTWFDTEMIQALEAYKIKLEHCNYPGTIKIINFSQFMQKLKALHAKETTLVNLECFEIDGKYGFRLGDMELVIKDDKTLHNLVFGNDMEVLKTEAISGDDRLLDQLKLILPIPIPYPYNLNFI